MALTQFSRVIVSFQSANANIIVDICHHGCHGLVVSPFERFSRVAHYLLYVREDTIGTYPFGAIMREVGFQIQVNIVIVLSSPTMLS